MAATCNVLCLAQCHDLSVGYKTLDALWTCLTFLCNVTVEDQQRTSFLSYLATNVSVNTNDSSYSNCTTEKAFLLKMFVGYSVSIKGYITPIIILLTTINNTLVCIVLLKPHMRSLTNALLVAIAIADTMTGLFQVPVFIYFYATERVDEWIPYNWCYAIYVLEEYIPTIFHTASIWLTMALAIQRYICVRHPFKARTWCTMRKVIYGISAICFIATLSHTPRFFETYSIATWRRSRLNHSVMVSACAIRWRSWIVAHVTTFFGIYFWFRVIFIHLIPCVFLVVLNSLLIFTMRKATKTRIQMLGQNITGESQHLKESNSTTLMLVTVVILFLLGELPIGVVMIMLTIKEIFGVFFFPPETFQLLGLFGNFFIQLSCPINFFIYCGMSRKFRDTFKRLFKCQKRRLLNNRALFTGDGKRSP